MYGPASLRRSALVASVVLGGAPAIVGAQIATINFGTESGFLCLVNGSDINFGAPIGGLNFTGLRKAFVGGGCVATNSGLGTNTATVTAVGNSVFSFQSANLAGAFSTTDVTVTGFLGANTVFSQALTGLPNGQTGTSLVTSPNFTAIDRLTITATGANAANQPFIVDNFTFGTGTAVIAAAVPEPATVALLASGLLVVGFGARRRRSEG